MERNPRLGQTLGVGCTSTFLRRPTQYPIFQLSVRRRPPHRDRVPTGAGRFLRRFTSRKNACKAQPCSHQESRPYAVSGRRHDQGRYLTPLHHPNRLDRSTTWHNTVSRTASTMIGHLRDQKARAGQVQSRVRRTMKHVTSPRPYRGVETTPRCARIVQQLHWLLAALLQMDTQEKARWPRLYRCLGVHHELRATRQHIYPPTKTGYDIAGSHCKTTSRIDRAYTSSS